MNEKWQMADTGVDWWREATVTFQAKKLFQVAVIADASYVEPDKVGCYAFCLFVSLTHTIPTQSPDFL